MLVLGIETSCDETGVAVYSDHGLVAHHTYSQIQIHQQYGGTVPELASRDHIHKLGLIVKQLLIDANILAQDIDAIAFTQGPGLVGALMVGASFAQSLAFAWNKPAVGIHHLEGHIVTPFLDNPNPIYPFLALLVSGGHTMLIDCQQLGQYKILGQSIDDAAGEAFDKIARLLKIGYPGGPLIEKWAKYGQYHDYNFPRPLCQQNNLNFSFSGLKTHVMNTYRKIAQVTDQDIANIACAFQEAITDCLLIKSKKALLQTSYQRMVIAGGVSANTVLRQRLKKMALNLNVHLIYPKLEFCTDNGAMIALAGYLRIKQGEQPASLSISPKARWPIYELLPPGKFQK